MNFNFINLQPYGNPHYFIYLMIGLIPIILGLYHGHRFKIYECIFSVVFLFLVFDADKWQQGVSLIIYLLIELVITYCYLYYRKKGKIKRGSFTWLFSYQLFP